jgi:hypothetical protein
MVSKSKASVCVEASTFDARFSDLKGSAIIRAPTDARLFYTKSF